MDDFKTFANNYKGENVNKNDFEKAQEVINKYSKYSESELAMELAKTIKEQKNNNLYNKDKVIEQINMLSSFLTSEQQQRLKDILDNAEKE